jgi:phospholipase/carboxylesterase
MTHIHGTQALLRAGASLDEATGAVVLLHGRGASAEDILNLSVPLGLPQVAYVAPQAAGSRWYPQTFLAPREQNEPDLSSALQRVREIVTALEEAGLPAERIAIGGFSQGACLSTEFVATYPKRYAAVLAFTGGLIGPAGSDLSHAGDLAGTPVFVANGDADPFSPWQRTLETAEQLRAMGASVEVQQYPGRPHTITGDEMQRAKALLEKALR